MNENNVGRKKPLKILFLGTQMETGGAQAVLFSQARYFHERGCSVYTAFFYDKERLYIKWIESVPFPIVNLRAWKYNDYWIVNFCRLIFGLSRLARLMLRERFDVIETFTNDSNLLGIPLAWALKIPVRIATHHGLIRNTPQWRHRLHGHMVNSSLTTCLVLVTNDLKKVVRHFEAVNDHKIKVIFNGVSLSYKEMATSPEQVRNELGLARSDLVVLSVGRLTEQKGHAFLLKAISKIKNQITGVKFVIVGDGLLRNSLENESRSLEIDHLVKFVGIRSDVHQLLLVGEIFVMPSLWEGLSLALLEAMSAGMTSIVSDVEGINDAIVDGVSGLIIPRMDANLLSTVLLKVINDKVLRNRIGINARKKVELEFSLQAMCQKYESLILSFLEDR